MPDTKAIKKHLEGLVGLTTAQLKCSVKEALAAVQDPMVDDEVTLGHLLDALSAIGPRRGYLNALHDLTQGEIEGPAPKRKKGARPYRSLKARHVGPFEEVDLDLDAIPGLLVAVTGQNGSGKSTLLEMLTGGLCFRLCENRGPLTELASARDSFVEGKITNGQDWTIRHDLDGVTGKGESSVTDAQGQPALESRKVRDFDAWAAKTLPPGEVLYASTVSPQKGKGFLEMRPGERLAILLRATGAEQLEQRAKSAREKAAEVSKRIDVTQARLDDERVRTRDIAKAELTHDQAEKHIDTSTKWVDDATAKFESARKSFEEARTHNLDVDAILRQLAQDRAAVQKAEESLAVLRARQTALRNDLDGADAVRLAVGTLEETAQALASAQEYARAATFAYSTAGANEIEADRLLKRGRMELVATERRAEAERDSIAKLGPIDEAGKLPAAREAASLATADLEASEMALEQIRSAGLASADDRAARLRGALMLYMFPGLGIETAREALQADDALLKARAERPAQIDAMVVATARRRDAVRHAVHEVERLTSVAYKAERAAERLQKVESFEAEAELLRSDVKLLGEAYIKAQSARFLAMGSVKGAEGRLSDITAMRSPLLPIAARAPALAEAQAKLDEIDRQMLTAEGAVTAAKTAEAMAISQPMPERLPVPDLAPYESDARTAANVLGAARTELALRARELEQARASAARIAELEVSLAGDREAQSDWTRLASDIDGVKLAEVDAAGPRLTAEANELLHTCVGPRFTVSIETQRPDSKGKKMIDGVEIRVMDSHPDRPREGSGESFSPGEQAILSEAVALALAILYQDRVGAHDVTLVRDETGSALDPQNGAAYIRMLRRAAAKVGASKVLFVTHAQAVSEFADARLHIEDGRVHVHT